MPPIHEPGSVEIGDLLAWLDAHANLEADGRVRAPSLERIRPLLDLLGRPQADYPLIHVTGTNGKTSTTRLIAHFLTARGLSVGAYTSPHLERVNERLAWGGEAISDDALAEELRIVAVAEQALLERQGPSARPTWFEVITAAGYHWFSDLGVQVSVAEVGLGGLWDATNAADAEVAVVTNVSIDHVEYLGSSRETIATEKAGIIKRGATLVLGESDPGLHGIFLERDPGRVLRTDVDFGVLRNAPAYGGRAIDLRTPLAEYSDLYLPVHGAHQATNAAIALTAAETFFGEPFPADLVTEALATFRTPGRLEVVGHEPLIILDGAHNAAGAEALVQALEEEFVAGPRTLIVGLMREKDPTVMLAALGATEAEWVFTCPPPSPRAMAPNDLAEAAFELGVDPGRVEVLGTVEEAVARALVVTPPEGQVVVAGSLYLVGAARAALHPGG
ncbi:MAG: folylpolyglutamate synthase/dihydrofolate synthase family protein [Actinomycetota bacterium]|jgi:dihydrofolate synthase / folylpolyglutamate synthase